MYVAEQRRVPSIDVLKEELAQLDLAEMFEFVNYKHLPKLSFSEEFETPEKPSRPWWKRIWKS